MTTSLEGRELKDDIIRFCKQKDADIVGFAPVERWDEFGEVPPAFRPRAIFPQARTVIVFGMSMPLPVVETTPSALHKEVYDTTNRQLDNLVMELTRHLNRMGHASFPFTRDTYTSMRALKEANIAAFGHVPAAKYAGLGTIGVSHCLLTPEFGPRVRFASVFTAADIPADALQPKELCIKCGLCASLCPKSAIKDREDQIIGDYDKTACLKMHEELVANRANPCGICTKVCPVGKDRQLYKSKNIRKKYVEEKEKLETNPEDPAYQSWSHIRRYGVSHKPRSGGNDKGGTNGQV
ncbi:MAG: 4Fe-4S binding protein [Smithellaceae bacterium]